MVFSLKEKPYYLFLLPLLFTGKHLFTIAISSPPSVLFSVLNFLGSVALCSAFSFGAYFIFSRITSKTKAAIISALIFICIFFFHDVLVLLNYILPGDVRVRWLIPAGSVIVLVMIFFIYRARRAFLRLNELVNLVSMALFVYLLVVLTISYPSLRPRRIEYGGELYQKTCTKCPDIYFFLLDSYTSNASLKKYFAFDNSKFRTELNDLGFFVNDTAYSDYYGTRLSLASTFNLGRIPDLEKYYEGDLHQMIGNNTTVRSLESWGYKTHNYSFFNILDQPKFYSITLDFRPQFLNPVLQNTIFDVVFDYLEVNKDIYSTHRNILRLTEKVATSKHDKPAFVYTHLLAPHPPFVIDSLGRKVPFLLMGAKDSKSAYVDQIKGLNRLMLETITTVRKSSPNAIVIVQGDHGFRALHEDIEKESHSVFFAYVGPNQPAIQKMRSSNEVFRVVLGSLGHE